MARNIFDDPKARWYTEAYFMAARARRIGEIGSAVVRLVEIQPGGQLLPHVWPNDALLVTVAGIGAYNLADATGTLDAGDYLFVPAQAIRSFTASGESNLQLLLIQAQVDERPPLSLETLTRLLPYLGPK